MRGQRYVTKQDRINAFEAKFTTEPMSGCWLWTGSTCRDGYGNFYDGKRVIGAHRFALEHYKNILLGKLHVLHLCDTPSCVNPDHLKTGTHKENMHDSLTKGRNFQASKTHCKRGHEFTPENIVRVRDPKRGRRCKTCEKLLADQRKERK